MKKSLILVLLFLQTLGFSQVESIPLEMTSLADDSLKFYFSLSPEAEVEYYDICGFLELDKKKYELITTYQAFKLRYLEYAIEKSEFMNIYTWKKSNQDTSYEVFIRDREIFINDTFKVYIVYYKSSETEYQELNVYLYK